MIVTYLSIARANIEITSYINAPRYRGNSVQAPEEFKRSRASVPAHGSYPSLIRDLLIEERVAAIKRTFVHDLSSSQRPGSLEKQLRQTQLMRLVDRVPQSARV